jgi:hypothetical protein
MFAGVTPKLIGLICGLAVAGGCAKDRSFLPPDTNEYVTVTIKVGNYLKTEPMRVMYRSAICKYAKYDGNFRRTDVDGYHSFDLSFQRKGETDLYEVRLPKDGGGQCEWRLSNVTFEVVHTQPDTFGANVSAAGGGGVVVVFDHNNAQRGSAKVLASGDVSIKKNYYPWIREGFLSGYYKHVVLYSGNLLYLGYKAPNAKRVYFEPVFYSDLVTHSVGPKVKKDGNYPVFTYPDGRVISDGSAEPDLDILEAIRAGTRSGK